MSLRMTAKSAAVAAASIALIATAVTGTASTTPSGTAPAAAPVSASGDNSNASVWGPREGRLPLLGGDVPCAEGAFCLYDTAGGSTHFELPHCTTYNLNNWNGIGGWYSNQTGGAVARIQDSRHNTIWSVWPEGFNYYADLSPAYYVVPC
ncbi:hypothetical protein [Streptomyces sp. G-G2]|uniref:hypothetical protein n=1 Tax=Streptomyces sp. G-G2 TaxID=3046201 RepID=UPI0024BB6CB6|nr:hypothetical protein [Streptomyces sp. G-G2]MDJ0380347.1 hypothetical protein [Streptomyces sp. G-G2]